MSKITKSPKKVARAAYKIAKSTLPRYGHRYSPKKFTQPQLFVCLILKIFLKTDYRGIAAILSDSPDLCKSFDLVKVPHFTTLQKASKKLLRFTVADKLIKATVRSVTKSTIDLAAIDSTGLDASYTSRYFVRRRRSKRYNLWEDTIYRRFPKLSIVCDCSNHLILSAITTRGPSVDVNQFRKPLKSAVDKAKMKKLLADAGYDSEANHQYARDVYKIDTIIPAKAGRPTNKLPKTKYRREMRTAEMNRQGHAVDKFVDKSLKATIKLLDKQIESIDKEIKGCINKDPEMNTKANIAESMPGIGEVTASMLVTELPELGSLTRRQIASLAGLAPIARDSGTFKGKRMTGGGRGDVRAKLYMPTLVAIQYNPAIREFYQRLLKAGKTKMTAVTACMRKMLTILNVMVARKEYWKSELYA